jgi:hypothetical protein
MAKPPSTAEPFSFRRTEVSIILTAISGADSITLENEAFLRREEEFAARHRNDLDEELLQYLIGCAAELDHTPFKHEVVGYTYLKSRFGPWPRVLEKAGLKEPRKKKRPHVAIKTKGNRNDCLRC